MRCERCENSAIANERFCKAHRKQYMRELNERGYLQPVPPSHRRHIEQKFNYYAGSNFLANAIRAIEDEPHRREEATSEQEHRELYGQN